VINGLAGNDTLYGDQCGATARLRPTAHAAAAGDGKDRLNGGQGDDKLFGAGAADRLSGEAGNDKLAGGSGNDRLSGGSGKDVLSGGAGRDVISAGAGNDRISSRDGKPDVVNCGPGRRDSVRADKQDRLRGCERARR
jgi:Ca2+-binding RTX toxin-like protein